ncbi:MAG: ATPase, T2SS/T4P/T4SS family, partial [[Clostridium] leptum]
ERFQPAGEGAILRYLSSGAVKGIGPVMAARLVDAFGDQTLEVLENHPERLASVKGISKAKAQQIASELHNLSGIQEVMSYLGAFGISPEEALQIWKVWGDAAVEMIVDPYVLCREPVSIDFERVDAIAASLERPHDERGRIRAGISYVLLHNMNNGHTCLPKDRLLPAAASYLEIEEELADEILYEMIQDLTLELDLINGREFIFTPKMHQCEIYIAARMLMMLNFPAQSITGVEEAVAAIEAQSGIQYAQQQKQAITEALSKGMLILTGGPGTGKTTTLNGILNILEQNGERVYLAAPTGRAAQRMSEVTRREAKTIHRLLEVEWDPQDRPVFTRNEKNMLDCDTLILDELSMVDNALFEGVLRALPLGCRLILVGDTDQLPSVGPGNVLGDLIASGLLPVVQLTEIFRQSMQSLIVTNAHQIVQGQMPELGRKDGDFFFLPNQDPVSIRDTIVDLCLRRLPASYGYSPVFDIQVLSPGRKG